MQIDDILKKNSLQTFFQPIVALDTGAILGYEALTRGPEGGALFAPLALFSEAKRYNRLAELDDLCRYNILHRAHEQQLDGLLFLNIDPASLFSRLTDIAEILHTRDSGLSEKQIVIEFTMGEDICKFDSFVKLVEKLKELGYHIACDNTVPGITEVLSVHNLRPDYIKIDLSENSGTETSSYQSACTLAQLMQAQIIVVGVQSAEQLRALAGSDIRYVQGNFLAPPAPLAPSIQELARTLLTEIAEQRKQTRT